MSKLIRVICGPTAGGKSKYALELATQLDGVIINADSMQVYKHLEIITAQPPLAEQAIVPHHLYGATECGTHYSVGEWLEQIHNLIQYYRSQDREVILVGGTGMYINALTKGISNIPDVSMAVRERVRSMVAEQSVESLHQELALHDPQWAAKLPNTDTQRISRGLEVYYQTNIPISQWHTRMKPEPLYERSQFHLTLINPPRQKLYGNCNQRFAAMLEHGLLAEVEFVMRNYSREVLPKAIGLREMIAHIEGDKSLDEAISLSQQLTRNYAKRQTTWFKNQLHYEEVVE